MGEVVDTSDRFAAIQRDLGRLDKWPNGNLRSSTKRKWCAVLLGRNKPIYQDSLGLMG